MTGRDSSHRQVALIRGVNVGKAKRVAMADLRALMGRLGLTDCRTLLNSGNVVFTSKSDDPMASAASIERAMAEELAVAAPVTVLSAADFAAVVEENPLVEIADNLSRLLVAFLIDPADRARLEPLAHEDWAPEAFALGSRAAYLWCPDGVLQSRLHQAVERALGKAVTARNWKTVTRISDALTAL